MNIAETPFEFFTVAHLTRIGNLSAGTLAELLSGLEQCSDASIFHHTFQTLSSHHYLTEGFSNDFAQWALADANRDALAEQLAALDIRDYTSIAALREDLCRVVRDYTEQHPEFAHQQALERFYFCESLEVTLPFGLTARTLDEFHAGVKRLSHAAFYFHFISSRLRLQLRTNDFSHWLANSLGLKTLAENIDRIDIYTNTLDSARAKLLRLVERERRKHEPSAVSQPHPAV
ncbi:MAG TPA: DUF5752 family protein [Candidatus Sulfotelmatobacter sp.]|nr:DUF5752 family protein [Candidatus Sulfotelmatobacter sp.]